MGVIDIANATMADAMRLISVQRGYDPREFCLVVVGGAGPMHGNQLADELNVPVVIMPPSPGVGSALGMLASDLRHDYCLTHQRGLDAGRFDDVNAISQSLRRRGLAELAGEGVARDQWAIQRYLDMRYVGQSWKLRMLLSDRDLDIEDAPRLGVDFSAHHQRSYGYSTPGEAVEIVNVGVLTIGQLPKLRLREVAGRRSGSGRAGAQADAPGLLPRHGLRRHADLRSLRPASGQRHCRAGHRRGDRFDDGRPAGVHRHGCDGRAADPQQDRMKLGTASSHDVDGEVRQQCL